MEDAHFDILKRHYAIWLMVHDDNYLPGGYHSEVTELNDLLFNLRGYREDLTCGTCIRRLFDTLYIPHDNELSEWWRVKNG